MDEETQRLDLFDDLSPPVSTHPRRSSPGYVHMLSLRQVLKTRNADQPTVANADNLFEGLLQEVEEPHEASEEAKRSTTRLSPKHSAPPQHTACSHISPTQDEVNSCIHVDDDDYRGCEVVGGERNDVLAMATNSSAKLTNSVVLGTVDEVPETPLIPAHVSSMPPHIPFSDLFNPSTSSTKAPHSMGNIQSEAQVAPLPCTAVSATREMTYIGTLLVQDLSPVEHSMQGDENVTQAPLRREGHDLHSANSSPNRRNRFTLPDTLDDGVRIVVETNEFVSKRGDADHRAPLLENEVIVFAKSEPALHPREEQREVVLKPNLEEKQSRDEEEEEADLFDSDKLKVLSQEPQPQWPLNKVNNAPVAVSIHCDEVDTGHRATSQPRLSQHRVEQSDDPPSKAIAPSNDGAGTDDAMFLISGRREELTNRKLQLDECSQTGRPPLEIAVRRGGDTPAPRLPSALKSTVKPASATTVGKSPTPGCPFAIGDEVEAKWGANWYAARIASIMGPTYLEVMWVKDGSRMHVSTRHVRRPKNKRASSDSVTVIPKPPDAKSATAPSSHPKFTSTQLVRMMDEEEEQDHDKNASKVKMRTPATTDRAVTSGRMQQTSTSIRQSKVDVLPQASQDCVIRELLLHEEPMATPSVAPKSLTVGAACAASIPVAPTSSSEALSQTLSAKKGSREHCLAQLLSGTPPSLFIFVSAASTELFASNIRARFYREVEGALCIENFNDFVHFASLEGSAPALSRTAFVVLLSPQALLPSSPRFHDEAVIALSSLAMGLTPVRCEWATYALDLLQGDRKDVEQLMSSLPEFVFQDLAAVLSGESNGNQLGEARLQPFPSDMRFMAKDLVWCPFAEPSAECVFRAAGASVLHDAASLLSTIDSPTSSAKKDAFVYVPPGRRVSSAMRDPRLAESLVHIELPWVAAQIVSHFFDRIVTRPTSRVRPSTSAPPGQSVTPKAQQPQRLDLQNVLSPGVLVNAVSTKAQQAEPQLQQKAELREASQELAKKRSRSNDAYAMQRPRHHRPALRIELPQEDNNSVQSLRQEEVMTLSHHGSGYQATVGDDFYFTLPSHSENEGPDEGGAEEIRIGRIFALHANNTVTMRLYEVSKVGFSRQRGKGICRFTTIALTDTTVSVPIGCLDFETNIFVIDECFIEHVYILAPREELAPAALGAPPPVDLQTDSSNRSAGADKTSLPFVEISLGGKVRIVHVGCTVTFRELPPHAIQNQGEGAAVSGVVKDIRREGPKGVLLMVEPRGDAALRSSLVVITPDMILSVAL